MSELITHEDLIELFGEAMPIEAVNLLWNCPGEWTLEQLRNELRKIAIVKQKKGLVERLRSEAVNWSATCGDLFGEAADRIEALEVDVERWHRVAMEAGAITCSDGRHIYPRRERIEALEKALRFARSAIATFTGSWPSRDNILLVIDAALAPEQDK